MTYNQRRMYSTCMEIGRLEGRNGRSDRSIEGFKFILVYTVDNIPTPLVLHNTVDLPMLLPFCLFPISRTTCNRFYNLAPQTWNGHRIPEVTLMITWWLK